MAAKVSYFVVAVCLLVVVITAAATVNAIKFKTDRIHDYPTIRPDFSLEGM